MDNYQIIVGSFKEPEIIAKRSAEQTRDALIKLCESCTECDNSFDAEEINGVIQEIKYFEKVISESHKSAKAPFLEVSRKIDAMKRTLLGDLEERSSKLQRMLGNWQAVEKAKKIEAEKAAKAALAKAESDAEIKAIIAKVDDSHLALQGVRVRTRKRWRITSPDDFAAAHRSMLTPNAWDDETCPVFLKQRIAAAIDAGIELNGIQVTIEHKAY